MAMSVADRALWAFSGLIVLVVCWQMVGWWLTFLLILVGAMFAGMVWWDRRQADKEAWLREECPKAMRDGYYHLHDVSEKRCRRMAREEGWA